MSSSPRKNRLVAWEIVEGDIDEAEARLFLQIEVERETPQTVIRAWLVGPRQALHRPIEVHAFQPVPPDEEDDPGVLTLEVVLPEPTLWSPHAPCRYEGTLELWQDGQCVDEATLHYSHYTLGWEEDEIALNEEPLPVCLRQVRSLDENTARRLKAEGVNVVLLPASETAAWELADRLGLLLLGELPADGSLPEDLLDRSVRPCCLGWVFPSADTPLPSEAMPVLFGVRSDRPVEDLPADLDFLLLTQPPDIEDDEGLGYPWIVRQS